VRLPGAPRVSRDGKRIVYTVDDVVMTADKSEVVMHDRDNLYLLRLSNNETKQLTDLKMGIRNFDFSPDGRWIAFTMTAPVWRYVPIGGDYAGDGFYGFCVFQSFKRNMIFAAVNSSLAILYTKANLE
jgi:dipeptidyl aminopeptidase/acylaminoacyl peptidase